MSYFVYAMTDGTATKVGFTGDLDGRKQALQSEYGKPLEILGAFPCPYGPDAERTAHIMLSDHAIGGEWFDVPEDKAVQVIEFASKNPTDSASMTFNVKKSNAKRDMKQVNLRLDPDEMKLLERFETAFGGKKGAIMAGLKALERRNQITKDEVQAWIDTNTRDL